ncbi:MAG TPA: hypothetical protein VGR03_14525 [Candidatus Acidoferrum sp.]|nr:hypothetical protein [Candidatus Acidoferrum sp.]
MLALIIFCILLTWLLCAAVCMGIGGLLLRGFRFPFSRLDAMWTGLAIITGILQLYHFFRPIDLVAVYLLVGVSLAGWFRNRSSLLHFSGVSTFNLPFSNFLLHFTAAAIIAFRCAALGEHYDTGLYGAQAVRWFINYPLVPGLGNVIGQLGFNSSVFLWIAALDQGPWRDLAHHLFAGFLIAALFASIIPAALRIFRAESTSAIDWFFTMLFVPATIWGATSKIVGTNTDLPTSVVCLVAAAILFRALGGESPHAATNPSDGLPPSHGDTTPLGLLIAMVLFSLAITFKISSLVFASAGWTVAVLKLWSLSRNTPMGKRQLVWAVILSAAIVLPWIGRGVVLTGYPFFPSTAFSIPVDWKVPAFETQMQADFARSFARVPDLTYDYAHGWHWLRPWFRELVREREEFLIPLLFALAGGVVGIIRMARHNRNSLPRWLWLLVPSLGGLSFWFLEAPAMRFGEPAIWTVGAALGTFAALHFLNQRGRIRIAVAGLLLLTAWAAHPQLLWSSYFRPSVGVRTFLRLPEAKLTPHQTTSGLTVHVPVETNQCWDAPLPCSPYFNETLHLRQPGKLERGFVSEESGAAVKWK